MFNKKGEIMKVNSSPLITSKKPFITNKEQNFTSNIIKLSENKQVQEAIKKPSKQVFKEINKKIKEKLNTFVNWYFDQSSCPDLSIKLSDLIKKK
jgi:hypothetical protein